MPGWFMATRINKSNNWCPPLYAPRTLSIKSPKWAPGTLLTKMTSNPKWQLTLQVECLKTKDRAQTTSRHPKSCHRYRTKCQIICFRSSRQWQLRISKPLWTTKKPQIWCRKSKDRICHQYSNSSNKCFSTNTYSSGWIRITSSSWCSKICPTLWWDVISSTIIIISRIKSSSIRLHLVTRVCLLDRASWFRPSTQWWPKIKWRGRTRHSNFSKWMQSSRKIKCSLRPLSRMTLHQFSNPIVLTPSLNNLSKILKKVDPKLSRILKTKVHMIKIRANSIRRMLWTKLHL